MLLYQAKTFILDIICSGGQFPICIASATGTVDRSMAAINRIILCFQHTSDVLLPHGLYGAEEERKEIYRSERL